MKKILSLAACALLAATMTVSAFAGEAKIAGMSSADFQDGYPLELGYDGDISTRMSITIDTDDGEDLIIELDKEYKVNGISVAWFKGHARFYDVEVSVSKDNQNWTVAAPRGDTKVAAAENGYSDLAFDKAYDAKYVKIHCWGKTDLSSGEYNGATKSWLTFMEAKVLTEDAAETKAPETTAAPETKAPETTAPAAPTEAAQTADVSVVIAAAATAAAAAAILLRKKK